MTGAQGSLASRLSDCLERSDAVPTHPSRVQLAVVLGGETSVSSGGYPFLSEAGFRVFVDEVPHLFAAGQANLDWLAAFELAFPSWEGFSEVERASVSRAVRVLRTMVFTAGVTSTPDLWVLRQVLAAHHRFGVSRALLEGPAISAGDLAASLEVDARQLGIDLHLLCARGYLDSEDGLYRVSSRPSVAAVLREVEELPAELDRDWVPELVEMFRTGDAAPVAPLLVGFDPGRSSTAGTGTWIASAAEIEIGFRLLPVVLALRVAGRTEGLLAGERAEIVVGPAWSALEPLLEIAGLAVGGEVTELGARVFSRGPGPFGIVAAYNPYFRKLEKLLRPSGEKLWVRRAENVAASQDANRKSFRTANAALDRFCEEHDFRYAVFIEHAVGQGEAVRQRFERDGESSIRYFGADLEDAAIDQAERQQRLGVLPHNMEFIRRADIGEPAKVIDYLASRGVGTEGAVMMVGNGFHEIRDHTTEKMIDVFGGYERAGILVIFTEETALSDVDLRATAWNTYHSGFRYVHMMSGQGLRPSRGEDVEGRWGWRRCAEAGGYLVLDEYSYRSRTIYPIPRPDRRNPAISMSYFCIPSGLATELGLPPSSD